MKAKSLLFLRASTGLLLIVWGLVRVAKPEIGAHVSEKYYAGLGAAHWVQLGWGAALLIIGSLTLVGLWRRLIYPLQALGDCQDFRVWAGIMGKKETHYVPTQGAVDSG
jgi:hypothetical protein